jgi:hypothetical protein
MAVFRVKASSTLPPAKAVWEVDVGDDPKQVLIYTNLGYDLIAVAMGKLGVAYSEYMLNGDDKALKALADEYGSDVVGG